MAMSEDSAFLQNEKVAICNVFYLATQIVLNYIFFSKSRIK